ncbi:MAG TPA: thiamine-phosphate kinase [Polyangiaceae bacterium]|nr:thiamine-phosphate kinase [Polyangiaceae bacterium]
MTKPSGRRAAGGEFELIAALARELRGSKSRAVELGIGDDAAVLRVGKERVVVSVDDQVEGVHFDLRWLSLLDVGYRALQAAASDLAAMGASALGAVASLQVPRGFPAAKLQQLARGQAQAARKLGCPVVGGNVTRGAVLSISTTVLGRVTHPVLRSGARPGDELWVIGELGLARAGLLLHQQGLKVPARLRAIAQRAKRAWARPEAQLAAGLRMRGRARAAMDVSDGLSGDVQHLARASGVKAVVEAARLSELVSPELCELGDLLGEPGAALALTGGEDYALLCAGPKASRPARAKLLGRIERGRGSEIELETGQRFSLAPGFDHLRR